MSSRPKNRPKFAVMVIQPTGDAFLIGPYLSRKQADADAGAWDGIDGCHTRVEMLRTAMPNAGLGTPHLYLGAGRKA